MAAGVLQITRYNTPPLHRHLLSASNWLSIRLCSTDTQRRSPDKWSTCICCSRVGTLARPWRGMSTPQGCHRLRRNRHVRQFVEQMFPTGLRLTVTCTDLEGECHGPLGVSSSCVGTHTGQLCTQVAQKKGLPFMPNQHNAIGIAVYVPAAARKSAAYST